MTVTIRHSSRLLPSRVLGWRVCSAQPLPFTGSQRTLHSTDNYPSDTSNDKPDKMHPAPNRLGLGMRPPLPSFGQGPSMGALAHQQQMLHHQQLPPPPKVVPVFIGSISGGISDSFLNDLLSVSDSPTCNTTTVEIYDRVTRLADPHNP